MGRGRRQDCSGIWPTAAKSKIGYLLSGPTAIPYPPSELTATVLKAIVATEREEDTLERFWNLESIGILPDETEKEEREFIEDYQNSSIRLENGRYNAKLPWKPNHPPLPTNEAIAKGRTRSTVRRLATDPEKLKAYNQIITKQQQRGSFRENPRFGKDPKQMSLPSTPCYPPPLHFVSSLTAAARQTIVNQA